MKGKILFVAGLGLGYVLGTRAGRERYEQIKDAARGLWQSPRVQKSVDDVEGFVKEYAPEVADFLTDNAKKLAGQVTQAVRRVKPEEGTPAKKSTTTRTSKSSKSAAAESSAAAE